jgi:uncharacterized protein YecE (DUF72 family)
VALRPPSRPAAFDLRVGQAGWSIPKPFGNRFPAEGSHLARYGAVLRAVEINSSFYRPHRPETYARWADTVPDDFRFAVKVPREITHTLKLAGAGRATGVFLGQVTSLGPKLGPLLVQLPPSLRFDEAVAGVFLKGLRAAHDGPVVCEPRHATWFTDGAEELLIECRVARVAADPAPVDGAGEPGGWPGLRYFRWHGSPRTYYSDYERARLDPLVARLRRERRTADVWCVFDNTALGAATGNALAVTEATAR